MERERDRARGKEKEKEREYEAKNIQQIKLKGSKKGEVAIKMEVGTKTEGT